MNHCVLVNPRLGRQTFDNGAVRKDFLTLIDFDTFTDIPRDLGACRPWEQLVTDRKGPDTYANNPHVDINMPSFSFDSNLVPGLDIPIPNPNGWSIPSPSLGEEPYHDFPNAVTIGLEFKFLIPLLPSGVADPCPNDPRPARWTTSTCTIEEVLVVVANIINSASKNSTITLPDIRSIGRQESDYWGQSWIVKQANSAEPGEEEKKNGKGYVWIPVEINSPRMLACNPDTLADIWTVVTALNQSFRLVTNYSCELHVHLGRFDGKPFTLRTLKKLGTLFWTAEPFLRSVKNPQSPNYHNKFTWSSALRDKSRLSSKQHQLSDPRLDIWKCPDSQVLGQLLSGEGRQYRRLGFNFSAFGLEDERAERSPRTVEVRFLEGCGADGDGATVNKDKGADQIEGWLRLCIAMVDLAISQEEDVFEEMIRRLDAIEHANSPKWTRQRGAYFEQIMRWLGIQDRHATSAFRSMIDGF